MAITVIPDIPEWEVVRKEFPNIKVPVLLVFGDHDWSKPKGREEEQCLIPNAEMKMIANSGHFSSLDVPEAVTSQIERFLEQNK